MTHKMKITLIAGGVAAGLLLLGGAGYAHYSHHHGADGWRNGGHHAGQHREGRYGHGKHDRGGMQGSGMHGHRDRDLTSAEIRTVAEAFLLLHGQDGMKAGAVTDGPNGGYLVEVLNADDTPAMQVELDRRSGRPLHGMGRRGGMMPSRESAGNAG